MKSLIMFPSWLFCFLLVIWCNFR